MERLDPATPTGKATAPDTFEPDGTRQTAHALVVGGPVETHTLYKSGDIDWFAVDTTSTPHSMSLAARYDIEFAVYTENGREVEFGSSGGDNAGIDIDVSTNTIGGGLLNQRFYIRVSAPNPKDTPPFYYAIALE